MLCLDGLDEGEEPLADFLEGGIGEGVKDVGVHVGVGKGAGECGLEF